MGLISIPFWVRIHGATPLLANAFLGVGWVQAVLRSHKLVVEWGGSPVCEVATLLSGGAFQISPESRHSDLLCGLGEMEGPCEDGTEI